MNKPDQVIGLLSKVNPTDSINFIVLSTSFNILYSYAKWYAVYFPVLE